MSTKKRDPNGVGHAIMRARRGANLTARQLGDEVGVSIKTMSRWENDETRPTLDQSVDMVRALATAPRELLEDLAAKVRVSLPSRASAPAATLASATHAASAASPSDPRLAFDDVILAGAEELDVSPRRLRAVMGDLLREMERLDVSLRVTRDAIAPLRKAKSRPDAH